MWETNSAVASSIIEMVEYGYEQDYFETYTERIHSLNLRRITNAAKSALHPDNMVWVIIGDRAEIEEGIREQGFGQIFIIDADGNIVER
jgi:zinc protease